MNCLRHQQTASGARREEPRESLSGKEAAIPGARVARSDRDVATEAARGGQGRRPEAAGGEETGRPGDRDQQYRVSLHCVNIAYTHVFSGNKYID